MSDSRKASHGSNAMELKPQRQSGSASQKRNKGNRNNRRNRGNNKLSLVGETIGDIPPSLGGTAATHTQAQALDSRQTHKQEPLIYDCAVFTEGNQRHDNDLHLSTACNASATTPCDRYQRQSKPGVQEVIHEEDDDDDDDGNQVDTQVKKPLLSKRWHKRVSPTTVQPQPLTTSATTNTMDQVLVMMSGEVEPSPGQQCRKMSQLSSGLASTSIAYSAGTSSSSSSSAALSQEIASRRSSSFAVNMAQDKCEEDQETVKLHTRDDKQECVSSMHRSLSATDCSAFETKLIGTNEQEPREILKRPRNKYKQSYTPPMKRTISRSMLEFDMAVANSTAKNRKFQVYWKDLTYSYELGWFNRTTTSRGGGGGDGGGKDSTPAKQVNVLNSISGRIKSNQLVAIIGPSGCGKTTLLQFLAGNNPAQQERLRIRGMTDEPKVAFIGQDDSLLPGLTAREILMFASRLQNSEPNFDHAAHIRPILSELGLSECADRSVSKLSGGQAKRVTIAQELLYPTNLLILDEVTSGLDASTSYSIVKLLKYLVSDRSYPMSIVMSIHQPSARLFSIFDKVYLMSDGCCLYEGSCKLRKINSYLSKFQLECPKYHNIADYLIELACCSNDDELTSLAAVVTKKANEATDVMSATQPASIKEQMIEVQRKRSDYLIDDLIGDGLSSSSSTVTSSDEEEEESRHQQQQLLDCSLYLAIDRARRRRPRPFSAHFRIHFERSLMRIRRSYILTYLQLLTYIVLGLQLATFYGPDIGQLSGCPRLPSNLMSFILASNNADNDSLNLTSDRSKSSMEAASDDDMTPEIRRIQENMNFLLVTVMTATFAALEITVITFPLEAKTIKREWRNGWYRVSSYFMGRTLADLPFQLAFVIIFCALIYTMTGQIGLSSWRFVSFVLAIVMTAMVAQSIGFIFGAMFMNNLPAAVFTAPLAIFPTLLFSGFFSRVSHVPLVYRPLTYLSHFRYAFDALLVTLYGYDRCNCDQWALTNYHASLVNQTSSMREMFQLLFGVSDCLNGVTANGSDETTINTTTTTPMPGELRDSNELISHEDLAAIHASNQTLGNQLISIIKSTTTTTTTMAPIGTTNLNGIRSFKQFEDMLVESIFQQMSSANDTLSSTTTSTTTSIDGGGLPHEEMSAMDRVVHRFSNRITTMLNKQGNFGHPMPRECANYNSYLLTEFDLNDDNLAFGLAMLFVIVIVTRLLSNFILHFTIATRVQ